MGFDFLEEPLNVFGCLTRNCSLLLWAVNDNGEEGWINNV